MVDFDPFDFSDLEREFAESWKANGQGSAEPRPPVLDPFCAADFEGKPVPRRQWEVWQYIPRYKPTLLYGDGGTGKSTLAMQLAVAKSAQTSWLGLETQPGKTLYLNAEDDDEEMHIRLELIRADLGLQWSDLINVQLQSLVGKDPALGVFNRQQGKVVATPLLNELAERIHDTLVDTVILDTLSDVFCGDENDRQQARGFIRILADVSLKTRATIIALAHPSVSGMASGTGTSGSTGWSNTARSRIYLYSDKDGSDTRTLQVMKANYGPKDLCVRLRWECGLYVPVSEATTAAEAKHSADAAEACFLRLLDSYNEQGRHVSDKSGANYAPNLFANDKQSRGIAKADLVDAMNRLFANNKVRVETFGSVSRPLRRIVRT
jgi:RecA-family ATPase